MLNNEPRYYFENGLPFYADTPRKKRLSKSDFLNVFLPTVPPHRITAGMITKWASAGYQVAHIAEQCLANVSQIGIEYDQLFAQSAEDVLKWLQSK